MVCQSNMTAILREAALFIPGFFSAIPQSRLVSAYRLTQDRLMEGPLLPYKYDVRGSAFRLQYLVILTRGGSHQLRVPFVMHIIVRFVPVKRPEDVFAGLRLQLLFVFQKSVLTEHYSSMELLH